MKMKKSYLVMLVGFALLTLGQFTPLSFVSLSSLEDIFPEPDSTLTSLSSVHVQTSATTTVDDFIVELHFPNGGVKEADGHVMFVDLANHWWFEWDPPIQTAGDFSFTVWAGLIGTSGITYDVTYHITGVPFTGDFYLNGLLVTPDLTLTLPWEERTVNFKFVKTSAFPDDANLFARVETIETVGLDYQGDSVWMKDYTFPDFGVYSLTFMAIEEGGGEMIVVMPNLNILQSDKPTIFSTIPSDAATYETFTKATAIVGDEDGVASVTFTVDDVDYPLTLTQGDQTLGTWTTALTLTQGTYSFSFTAVDGYGVETVATGTFTIEEEPAHVPWLSLLGTGLIAVGAVIWVKERRSRH